MSYSKIGLNDSDTYRDVPILYPFNLRYTKFNIVGFAIGDLKLFQET